jgi:hypothetical protein
MKCFFDFYIRFQFTFLSIIISAEQFIVPPAGLPNQGLLKKHSEKLAFAERTS